MSFRDYAQQNWRAIDSLTLINLGIDADKIHKLPREECWWDERCYVFWVERGSKSDFWLGLQGI